MVKVWGGSYDKWSTGDEDSTVRCGHLKVCKECRDVRKGQNKEKGDRLHQRKKTLQSIRTQSGLQILKSPEQSLNQEAFNASDGEKGDGKNMIEENLVPKSRL